MYKINFIKLQKKPINGVYFDNNFRNIPNDKYKYLPISFIDENISNHFTLILFTLKEYFKNIDFGFEGWNYFKKNELLKLIQSDSLIYISQYNIEFYKKFPKMIDAFLEIYCDKY